MESQPIETRAVTGNPNGHVQEVVRQAHEELRQLLHQRAEVMRRIGTIKQTIAGLANLFGEGVLSDELLNWSIARAMDASPVSPKPAA